MMWTSVAPVTGPPPSVSSLGCLLAEGLLRLARRGVIGELGLDSLERDLELSPELREAALDVAECRLRLLAQGDEVAVRGAGGLEC